MFTLVFQLLSTSISLCDMGQDTYIQNGYILIVEDITKQIKMYSLSLSNRLSFW